MSTSIAARLSFRLKRATGGRLGILFVCIVLIVFDLWYPFTALMLRSSALTVIRYVSMQMTCYPIAFGILLSSIIAVVYFACYECAVHCWKKRVRGLQEEITFLSPTEKNRLLDISRQGRESGMLSMGNLFIPTAFLLLAAAATAPHDVMRPLARIVLAISAPSLYVLWLFLVQLSTRLMDDVDSDMRLYAKGGTAGLLHDFYDDRHGFGVVMRLRRNHWLAYVPLLTIAAALIVHSILGVSVSCP